MNRLQAAENLKSLGIEEPSEEQITNYLNTVHGETKKEKDRADALKAQADKVGELQKQLDAIENANLSEVEKANKATEDANKQIEELTKKIADMELKNQLAQKGIIGDDADNLIKDGKLDIETLGKIISARETAAASAKEQEILKNTPNPQGNSGESDGKDALPPDMELANLVNFQNGVDATNKDYYLVH